MTGRKPTLYIVGDSTLSSFDDNYYIPRYGYGTQLHRYLGGINVVNLALSGRSSKSFLTEDNYNVLRHSLSSGDFLVIGFGHNDEKREEERYTNPNLPYTDGDLSRGLSFRYNLFKNYICLARDRGATPVLCTPIVRLSQDDDYSGVCGHVTQSVGGYDGGDYPAAIRSLGRDAGVTVIDLTRSSMDRYRRCGHERAARFHAWAATSGGVPAGLDGTHLNKYGAAVTAYEWADMLRLTDNPLRNYLLPELVAPRDEEFEEAVNANYREPEYHPFTPEAGGRLHFALPAPWYATVMGDFGGVEHIAEFTIGGDGSSFTVGNLSTVPRGGIKRSSDGFAAAFLALPADCNFTASAKCEVLSLGEPSQCSPAFGVMLRDDIYCDSYLPALCTNYVAAGAAGGGQLGLFCREGGKADFAPVCGFDRGDKFTIKVERVNQQIKVSLGSSSRSWFDFDLSAVDAGQDYLCLFAANGALVRFSDVTVERTGKAVRA